MLVSVIIPVYNSEKTIARAIESVKISVERVTTDYEIICINDGSNDNSLKILEELAKTNNHVRILDQKNTGAAAARNNGLDNAKGDFIAFNDSDDEWIDIHFETLLNLFDMYPEFCCISGNHDIEKSRLPKLKNVEQELYEITLNDEVLKNYFSPQATMIRRIIVDDGIRFKNGMRYAEEGYFFYTVAKSYRCAFINYMITKSIIGKAKFGDGGLSGNLKEMEKGEIRNLKYAHKELGIGTFHFLFLIVFSLIKYIRRVLIVAIRGKRG